MNEKIKDRNTIYQYLNRMIDSELEKEDPDMSLIDECNALLDSMEKGIYEADPHIKSEELQKLYATYQKKQAHNKTVWFRHSWNRLATAACIAIMVLVIPMTVAAFGGCTPVELIERIGNQILKWTHNEEVEIEGITFVRNGDVAEYGSISECLKEENLDICYPTWLPEGMYIKSVLLFSKEKGDEIILELNDSAVTFSIALYEKNSYEPGDYSTVEVGDRTVYYIMQEFYDGNVLINGYQYSVSVYDFDTMIKILQSLERVN